MKKSIKKLIIISLSLVMFLGVVLQIDNIIFATDKDPFTYAFSDVLSDSKLTTTISLCIDKTENIEIKEIHFKEDILLVEENDTQMNVKKQVDTNDTYEFEVSYVEKKVIEKSPLETQEENNDIEVKESMAPVSKEEVKKQVLTYEVKDIEEISLEEKEEILEVPVDKENEKEESMSSPEINNNSISSLSNSEETNIKFFIFGDSSNKGKITGYVTSAQDITGSGELVDPPRDVVIPREYRDEKGNTVAIKEIGDNAFAGMSTYIDSITLNDNLISIGEGAFKNLVSLESMVLPNSLKTIADMAFLDCKNLKSVSFPPFQTNPDPDYPPIIFDERMLESIGRSAFSGCASLTNIEIPSRVTSIGGSAFRFCTSLTSIEFSQSSSSTLTTIPNSFAEGCGKLTNVTLPKTLTKIEDNAFSSCSTLASIDLPESVTSIGDAAFSSCKELTSITIPSGVTAISDLMFSSCQKLASITLPSGVTSIGNRAFSSCYELANITIPSGVTSIGNYAFSSCSKVTSITIPSGVTSIKDSTFSNSGLTNIVIPNNVTAIGDSVFAGCQELTNINLPNSLISIGASAFSSCERLTNIDIPNSVTVIGSDAFKSVSIKEIRIDKDFNTITGKPWGASSAIVIWKNTDSYEGCFYYFDGAILGVKFAGHKDCKSPETHTSGIYNIPESIDGKKIVAIGDYAFRDENVKTINIPASVTSIGEYAFSNCKEATNINVPNSVTDIGNFAFSNCSQLTNIDIPSGLTTVGDSVFYNCKGLTSIVLPDTLTSIGDKAFAACTGLKAITIPNSVTSIGSWAFATCSQLTSVNIPDTLTTIEDSVFYNCGGLTSIILPDGLTSIEKGAFGKCVGLTDIVLPDSLTNIGGEAFAKCVGLTSVTFPVRVSMIEKGAFYDCTNLVDVVILGKNTKFGDSAQLSGAFENCTNLKNVAFPPDYEEKTIAYEMFKNCSSLRNIDIPDSITDISIEAFAECTSLQSIVLPKNLWQISAGAFENCRNLFQVNWNEKIWRIQDEAFKGTRISNISKLPSSIQYIGTNSFDSTMGLILIDQPRSTAPNGLTGTQPWGATNAEIYYKGEFIDFEYTIEKKGYDRIIHYVCTAGSSSGLVQTITLPNGSIIPAVSQPTYSGQYTVNRNGEYDFNIFSSSNKNFPYQVIIDDIGKMKFEANDIIINKSMLTNITTIKELLDMGFVRAMDIDLNKEIGVVSNKGLDEIKTTLVDNGDTVSLQLTATNEFGTTETKTIKVILIDNGHSLKYMDGTNELMEVLVKDGSKAINWQAIKENATFSKWYSDKDLNTPFDFDVPITKDTVVYAKWIDNPNLYIVRYDTGTDFSIEDKNDVRWDDDNLLPVWTLDRKGYTFENWKVGSTIVTKDTKFKDISSSDVNGTVVTLQAQWRKNKYTINFVSGNPSDNIPSKTGVTIDDTNFLPMMKKRPGYSYDGFQKDGKKVDGSKPFGDIITDEKDGDTITLTAKWKTHHYTIAYNSGQPDISIPSKTNVASNENNLLPDEPMKKGYTFEKWTFGAVEINETTKLETILTNALVDGSTITLTGQWKKNEYTIDFDSGQPDISIPSKPGVTVDDIDFLPTNPTKPGYDFDGWEVNGQPIDPNKPFGDIITNEKDGDSVTITGTWKKKKYEVDFIYVGDIPKGFETKKIIIEFEDKVIQPLIEEPKGYTFIGWYSDVTCSQFYDFNNEISANISLYGKWVYHSPEEPSEPEEPDNPGGGTITPGDPEKPDNPGGGTTTPGDPEKPSNPGGGTTTPGNPEKPSNPGGGTTTPENPGDLDKEIIVEVTDKLTKDEITSGLTKDKLKDYIRAYTKDGEEDYTVLSGFMNNDSNQYEVTIRLSNGELRTVNIDIDDTESMEQCLYDWLILFIMVMYSIYGGYSLYRAKRAKEVRQRVYLLRYVLTGVSLLSISVFYILCTCGLAIYFYVPSVVVLLVFLMTYHRQKNYWQQVKNEI